MARQNEEDDDAPKRSKVSQSEFPNVTLGQASRIAKAIWENFAGKGGAPHQIAMALDLSPTSGGWRNLCGSSIAYGLTDGGYNASTITLTELGRKFVAPTQEGQDQEASIEAILKPRIQREFFQRYNRAKFPRDDIAKNVLVEMGLPKDRCEAALDILKANGETVGIIQQTKTGLFVAVDSPQRADDSGEKLEEHSGPASSVNDVLPILPRSLSTPGEISSAQVLKLDTGKAFITHGKNKKVLEQIKRAVTLGGFEPVVSVQQETAAKPVPEKVLDDMRSCSAAVIHVGVEAELTDKDGKGHVQINPNVLIEIGAAMALYRGRFILVVEEGVELPSNLQGLYQCRYSGDGLDWDAGMKILEALRGLKANAA
jgi:predicted nucleotide-binding protein